jgi:hypothetical protein
MPTTGKGKRSVRFSGQIVQDGTRIRISFDGHDTASITFNRGTGASGPKAYGKLEKVLDEAAAKEVPSA